MKYLNRKTAATLMAIIMLCSMYFLAQETAVATLSGAVGAPIETERRKVVIDAGHGANDPGKIGVNGALEKDINLRIALKTKEFLEQNGIEVIMTRVDDGGLYDENASNKKVQDMKRRLEIIEASGAPVVVSIHQNSYGSESIKGAQVFYYTKSKEGEILAGIMQKQLVAGLDKNNHRVEKGNTTYYLLKASSVPTVIVECGFLSNWEEAALLAGEEYQEKVAWNIHLGILKYFNQ